MVENTVVTEQTENGKRLIEVLATAGFEVQVAFWAKPTEEDKWYLYLASPFVGEKGGTMAYRFVFDLLRKNPDLWIDPFEIKLIDMNDSLTAAALSALRSRFANTPFAKASSSPSPGMTQIGGSTLGGMSIDGAYIYPPSQAGELVR